MTFVNTNTLITHASRESSNWKLQAYNLIECVNMSAQSSKTSLDFFFRQMFVLNSFEDDVTDELSISYALRFWAKMSQISETRLESFAIVINMTISKLKLSWILRSCHAMRETRKNLSKRAWELNPCRKTLSKVLVTSFELIAMTTSDSVQDETKARISLSTSE